MKNIFLDFDINRFDLDSFKESSVREEIIIPFFSFIGIKNTNIERGKKLQSNYVMQGSIKKIINKFPDYIVYDNNHKTLFVMDAKSPNEKVIDDDHIEQIFSYASHREIQTDKCLLCNGREFALFIIPSHKPVLKYTINELDENKINILKEYLLFSNMENKNAEDLYENSEFDYLNIKFPKVIKKPRKQANKISYGVHGYFTKQSWDIVESHIKQFTKIGDLVLDPFSGSGVTFIESVLNGRSSIYIDLNPLTVFWMKALFENVSINLLQDSVDRILKDFNNLRPKNNEEINKYLKELDLPENLNLPKTADAEYLHDIFSKKQMAELALLKSLILKEEQNIRDCLLLAFSSSITQNNLTYHTSKHNEKSIYAGDAGIFRYYRYRIAPNPTEVDLAVSFKNKAQNLINAKIEINKHNYKKTLSNSHILKGNATNLVEIEDESVDYIYTDPPYGAKIEYLDLSIMWNAWLDLKVSEEDYKNEAIEGGKLNKTSEEYQYLIKESIKEMFRVLKWNRWLSFVFQHQDPKYWHLIVETAINVGFEYAGCQRYSNGQTSFKKRQNPFSVLSGQLIIYFKKINKPKTMIKHDLGADILDIIINNIEALIAKNHGVSIDEIYDDLIVHGLELGFLDILSEKYSDLTPILNEYFEYDSNTKKYHLKKNNKFKSHIPVDLRIRYFLKSYLQRENRNKNYPTFDDIILDIMPMLKNGITPEEQTIKNVLNSIAMPKGDGWILNSNSRTLFD